MKLSSLRLRSLLIAAVCFAAPFAKAIVLDFSVSGIGSYAPASAANNDSDVTTAVNAIISWYNGGSNPNGGAITYTLSPGSGVPSNTPLPVTFGFKDETNPFDSFNSSDYSYVLGKYGNVAYVFYIGNLAPGTYSLPSTLGGNGLSHEVLFTSQRTSVPDGGTTMVMLGIALLGLEMVRRRLKFV